MASQFSKVSSRRSSFYALTCTALIHLVGFLIFTYARIAEHITSDPQPSLQMIVLRTEASKVATSLQPPVINFQSKNLKIDLPFLESPRVTHTDLARDYSSSDMPYTLPDKNSELYGDVFDPKLRKKLNESLTFNKLRSAEKLSSWTTSDGRIFTDMGDGTCMVADSKPKTDSRDRGTSYTTVDCGKTDSEKMMDNVNSYLESRKSPLGNQ